MASETCTNLNSKLDDILSSLQKFGSRIADLEASSSLLVKSNTPDRSTVVQKLLSDISSRIEGLENRMLSLETEMKRLTDESGNYHKTIFDAISSLKEDIKDVKNTETIVQNGGKPSEEPLLKVRSAITEPAQLMLPDSNRRNIFPVFFPTANGEIKTEPSVSSADSNKVDAAATASSLINEDSKFSGINAVSAVAVKMSKLFSAPIARASASTGTLIQTAPPLQSSQPVAKEIPTKITYSRQQLLDIRLSSSDVIPPCKLPSRILRTDICSAVLEATSLDVEKIASKNVSNLREQNMLPVISTNGGAAEAEVCREVRETLDKLSRHNFDMFAHRILYLLMDEGGLLKEVSDRTKLFSDIAGILLEKALSDPHSAELCAKMSIFLHKTEFIDNQGRLLTFRKMILHRCQRMFEEIASRKSVDSVDTENEAAKASEETVETAKKSHIGAIIFVCELYQANELTLEFAIHCIYCLMKKLDDDAVECLCKMFYLIGKRFERQLLHVNSVDQLTWWHQCLGFLEGVVAEKKKPAHLCSMIHDVLKARKQGWNSEEAPNGSEVKEETRVR